MEEISGIYLIRISKYYYIGSSNNLYRRSQRHLSELKRNNHFNDFLQNVYNKYKEYNFYVLEECSEDKLLILEQEYLDIFYDEVHCLNLSKFVYSIMRGRVFSKEHREKLREHGKRRGISDEVREKARLASIGRKWNDNQKVKSVHFGSDNGVSRAIQLEFTDGSIKKYVSLREAEKDIGVHETTIRDWIKGKTKFPFFSQSKKFKHLNIITGKYLEEENE